MKLPRSALWLVSLGLLGCASSEQKLTGWLSSNADAFAVIDGRVLLGKANFTREREASLVLQTDNAPSVTCSGSLHYLATNTGQLELQCSDGRSGNLNFIVLGAISGTARGQIAGRPTALTYGLSAERAAPLLGLDAARLEPPKPATPATPGAGAASAG